MMTDFQIQQQQQQQQQAMGGMPSGTMPQLGGVAASDATAVEGGPLPSGANLEIESTDNSLGV